MNLIETKAEELLAGYITPHDEKFYDERMTVGSHGCYLTNLAINKRKGTLALVIRAVPTDGSPVTIFTSSRKKTSGKYYTVRLRILDVDTFIGDMEDFLLSDENEQIWRIQSAIINCDIEVWSNSIDWFMQGRWEWASNNGYSYYDYTGPTETGRWRKIKGSDHSISKHMIEVLTGLVKKRSFAKAVQQGLNIVYGDQFSS